MEDASDFGGDITAFGGSATSNDHPGIGAGGEGSCVLSGVAEDRWGERNDGSGAEPQSRSRPIRIVAGKGETEREGHEDRPFGQWQRFVGEDEKSVPNGGAAQEESLGGEARSEAFGESSDQEPGGGSRTAQGMLDMCEGPSDQRVVFDGRSQCDREPLEHGERKFPTQSHEGGILGGGLEDRGEDGLGPWGMTTLGSGALGRQETTFETRVPVGRGRQIDMGGQGHGGEGEFPESGRRRIGGDGRRKGDRTRVRGAAGPGAGHGCRRDGGRKGSIHSDSR